MRLRFLLSILFIFISSPRIFESQFKFSLFGVNKGWIYLDKMAFAPGNATIHLQTSTTGTPYGRNSQIFLQAIKQDKWQQQMKQQCKNPIRMPLSIHQIKLDTTITQSRFSFILEDYQLYYFVLKDCQSRLINDFNNSNLVLNLKLHMLNNGKELGEEEDHWYIVPFIVIAGVYLVHLYMKEYQSQVEVDWPKILLFAGTVTQISSLCWKSFGFLLYLYSGSDYFFFHLIYLFLHSTSESAVIALVTLIGFGWTLTYNYGAEFDVFLPIFGALGIINIVITMITKIGHSHDRHHIFDNIGGHILIGFRVFILLIFIGGTIYTYRSMRHQLKKFMVKFFILAFLYIASTPIIVMAANYTIAAKNRHEFVFIAIEATKFIVNLTLSYQFNWRTSQYNRVNYKNTSFLPEEGFQ